MALANNGELGLTNRFKVTATPGEIELGFWAKVDGLKVTWEMPDHRTGDGGNTRYYATGFTKYPDVKLTRSANPQDSPAVQKWLADCSKTQNIGEIKISLHGPNGGQPIVEWVFKESVPLEWSVSAFDASSSSIALETLTFTHNGFLDDESKIA